MVKGQVEFIAIIGIIAVVIVAVYFAFTSVAPGVTPTAPVYTSAEQASVADTVNSFVRDGVSETLRTLSTYGGYLSPQADSVTYLGRVPYGTSTNLVLTGSMHTHLPICLRAL